MKTIDTLVTDIYDLLDKPNKDMEFDLDRQVLLAKRLVGHIRDEVRDPDRSDRAPNETYVTQFTPSCDRRVWYNLNADKLNIPRERIRGSNRFKFLYGDLIEESVLYLAELAGHTVEMCQERLTVEVDGVLVSGRIDAIIDGTLVDVKSMEQYSFAKLEGGTYDDKWGYYTQLGIYDHMLTSKGVGLNGSAILGVNKTNGKIHVHHLSHEDIMGSWAKVVGAIRNGPELLTSPFYEVTNKSGNDVLAASCAYCPFKFHCWETRGGLEVYAYSDGPTFIPKPVKRPPKVPCITEAYIKDNLS